MLLAISEASEHLQNRFQRKSTAIPTAKFLSVGVCRQHQFLSNFHIQNNGLTKAFKLIDMNVKQHYQLNIFLLGLNYVRIMCFRQKVNTLGKRFH